MIFYIIQNIVFRKYIFKILIKTQYVTKYSRNIRIIVFHSMHSKMISRKTKNVLEIMMCDLILKKMN